MLWLLLGFPGAFYGLHTVCCKTLTRCLMPVQARLDARHLLLSLASGASALTPPNQAEALRRARDRFLAEQPVSLELWRAARPAADTANTDDKWEAVNKRALVRATLVQSQPLVAQICPFACKVLEGETVFSSK